MTVVGDGTVRLGFTWKRRTTVAVAAAAAVLLAGGLALALASGGGQAATGVTHVDGDPSAVLYASGHRAQVPGFSGTTLTGAKVSLADYRGKVVVLNFWGSWCGPCRSEGPALAALSSKYQASGVSFLGVDVHDTPANATAFARGVGIKYPSLNDPGYSVALALGSAVPISGTPTTVVVDQTGHVAGAVFGSVTYSVLNSMLSQVASR
jgi:thiol-disulfide isomerase/thioredoxin